MKEKLEMPEGSFPKLIRIKLDNVILLVVQSSGRYYAIVLTGENAGTNFGSIDSDNNGNIPEDLYEVLPLGTKLTLTQR
ncbi:MAG: hypothetical protein IID03_12045 [Candidatus Dadabacteria bacterium]|nr:hypothetical protein [Candidatus Dadabacteria bacterium]